MATITIEFGKVSSKKTREVYLLVRQGTTRRRVKTGIKLSESEISPKSKRIKSPEKAVAVEKLRCELQENMDTLEKGAVTNVKADANCIAAKITRKKQENELEFFAFADNWVKKATIKGAKNYRCMLNTMESFWGSRKLFFPEITVAFLKDFENYLSERPRAQSLYLGQFRHLYREAMLEYNTDEVTIIKNDPFIRYKAPKQVMKKGVRALSYEDFMKVFKYSAEPDTRAELAHDCFVLSFCLMGINSADLYNAKCYENGTVKYNRTKTKDRRSDDAYIEVKVHPFIKKLFKKWQDKDGEYVFNFHNRYADENGLNHAINIGLKTIGKAVGIDALEFYQARHTFATLSRNLMKFNKNDVDEALNHVGSLGIADVYISKDFSIINDNNFKLIDKVFGCGLNRKKDLQTLLSCQIHPDVLP